MTSFFRTYNNIYELINKLKEDVQMKEIVLPNAKKINSHYSPGILSKDDKTIYVSGQLPIDPVTREVCDGDISEQTYKALENVEKVLMEVGGTRENILRTTAYVDDMESWEAVNRVYADFFRDKKPVRTIVCVNKIHFDLKIEIEAIAEL